MNYFHFKKCSPFLILECNITILTNLAVDVALKPYMKHLANKDINPCRSK